VTLTYTVGWRRPGMGGFGKLIVEDDAVVLRAWPIARELVAHGAGPITVVRARFAPSWKRTGIILRGGRGAYGVDPLPGAGGRILAAIAEAGFETVEYEMRISRFPWSVFERPRSPRR
jgi:hypothetical protein